MINPIFSQQKWSLEDCINYAKENNIDVQRQILKNTIVEEDISIAKGNYYPDLSFTGTQGYSLGNSFNVSTGVGQLESRFNSFSFNSSFNLFNGLSNKYSLSIANLNKEKGLLDLDQVRLDLTLKIANKYLTVLFNKQIIDVAKEQELISEQEVDRLTKLYEAALKSNADLLEMESTHSLDVKNLAIAENNYNNSLVELKQLMDIKSIQDFDVKDVDVSSAENRFPLENLGSIVEKSLSNNPSLKSSETDSLVSQKKLLLAKSQFYPRLNFNYSYGSSYYHIQGTDDVVFNQDTGQFEDNGFLVQLNNNRTHYLGFTLVVPIFNKFLTKSNVDKEKVNLNLSEVELLNKRNELSNKIEIAYNDVLTAKATLESSESVHEFQAEAFKIAQNKYKQGLLTSYEFLDSKSKYINSQSELIKAKYDYIFKILVLEYYKNEPN